MSNQYNHHCIVTAWNRDWFIIGARPGSLRLVRASDEGIMISDLDTSRVDWDAYCEAAVRWDYTITRKGRDVIIGFTGLIGAGKTTAATHLVRRRGFTLHKYAAPLKHFCQSIGLTYQQHSGDQREVPLDMLCGKSPRQLQQLMGTEFGRDMIGSDLWVKIWKHTLPIGDIVVDDVRFPNEVAAIHAKGGKVIRIEREQAGLNKQQHRSEEHELPFDLGLNNDASIDDFLVEVDGYINFIHGR